VGGKRATASLFQWHDDFAAVGGEHADGSFLQSGKSHVGNAAGKKGNACTPPSHGRKRRPNATKEKIIIDAREEAVSFGKAKQLENPDAACDRLQAGPLVEAEKTGRIFDKMGSREKLLEKEVTCGASEPGALVTAFDTCAGVFDQPPVFDAGWAGGFTSAAVKTLFDVLDEPIADARFRNSLAGEFTLKDVEHLLDAATRRIRLEIPQSIGGAGIEAKAAADAASVVLVDRRRARDRVYRHGVRC